MAKEKENKKRIKTKKTSRLKQIWQVYDMTRKVDKTTTPTLLTSIIFPTVIALTLILILEPVLLSAIIWIIFGLLTGLLIAAIILGRKAEKVAYQQIEGMPGAVGAVISQALKRSWRGSDTPVALNPKTKDVVYRVTGKGGVVLIGEGDTNRLQRLFIEEEKKVKRIAQGVTVSKIVVGNNDNEIPLWKLSSRLLKMKTVLNKNEVYALENRLSSIKSNTIGIPKGIDPFKIKPQRPR